MARAYMFNIAAAATSVDNVEVHQHVDDLSHSIVDAKAPRAESTAIRVAEVLAPAITKAHLKVANKAGGAVVVASNMASAKRVATALRRLGLPFKAATHTEDLGISTAVAGVRVQNSLGKRAKKAGLRSRIVAILRKSYGKAKWLAKTNIGPCQSY